MNRNASMPSLLPYLEPNDARIRMDIIGASPDAAESTPNRFPFRVLSEASPLTRLLRADILTDAGSLVQPVFLIVQKDTYRYQPSELWPLSNLDIEACWRQPPIFMEEPSGKSSPEAMGHDIIRLKDAGVTGGSGTAFQSLFFCGYRRVFFHPPCPGCGRDLLLCKDDSLLLSQGLSAYGTSLRRYLYCPSCPPAKEGNGFYASALESADSAGVRDGIGLIAAWRYLLASSLAPDGFPCLNCPERDKCHGSENLSAIRIIPFGFYPFHLRVVKAMTIRAADFLPLVSGASTADVEKQLREKNESERLSAVVEFQRMMGESDLFLFDGTEKHFLEILYLKLSLLNEITEMIRTGPALLDFNAALDCLWLKIPRRGSFLPGLWSFTVGYMDIGLTRHAALGRPGANEAQLSYFLGLLWFHFLLTNSSQPAAVVIAALTERLEKNKASILDFLDAPLFAPENIFWNPAAHDSVQFPNEWKGLWEKTLGLAWSLLTVSPPGAEGSSNKFQRELSILRNELKRQLFFQGAAGALVNGNESDDRDIHKILTGIIAKWETPRSSAQSEKTPLKASLEETVLLSGSKFDETLWDTETTLQSMGRVPEPTGEAETIIQSRITVPEPPELAETIIQTAGGRPQVAPEAESIMLTRNNVEEALQQTVIVTKSSLEDELEKTVHIAKAKAGTPVVPAPLPPRENIDDGLCETVILSGKTTSPSPLSSPSTPSVKPAEAENEEEGESDRILSETIILRPPPK